MVQTRHELGGLLVYYAKAHYLQYQPHPWLLRALAARHPRGYHPKTVTRVRGTVGGAKILQFTKSRRRVSVVELPAQHLEKKGESRRTVICSVNSSRDLLGGRAPPPPDVKLVQPQPYKRSRELLAA